MPAAAIIRHFYKIKDDLTGLFSGLEVVAVDQFLFAGAPEGFRGDVVITVAFTKCQSSGC
jgi:hypothetical protein